MVGQRTAICYSQDWLTLETTVPLRFLLFNYDCHSLVGRERTAIHLFSILRMKKLVFRLLLFFASPVIFIALVDFNLRDLETLYRAKYISAQNSIDSLQILILGNSHATYGIDSKGFSMYAFNIANVNQSLYFDKRITLSLLDSAINLRYVLISIDYHSLYFSSQDIRNIWSYYGNGIKYKDHDYTMAIISPFLFGFSPRVGFTLIKRKLANSYRGRKIILDLEDDVNPLAPLQKGFMPLVGINEGLMNEVS